MTNYLDYSRLLDFYQNYRGAAVSESADQKHES